MHSCLRLSAMALTFLCLNSLWAQTDQQFSLYYETDQYGVDQHQSDINAIASAAESGTLVCIYGYTDDAGTVEYNKTLAYNRAKTVSDALIAKGVNGEQITVIVAGEAGPIGDNSIDAGRSKNRRVDVFIGTINQSRIDAVQNAFLPKVQRFTIDPGKPNTIAIGSNGTVLTVPANAFTDANGKVVTTPVTLEFTEYTTTGDILFSEIPMTYQVNGKEQRFSSAGMFNIQGNTNGMAIEIGKNTPLTIDYAMTDVDDVAYYGLNENNTWEKISDIKPKPVVAVQEKVAVEKKTEITNTGDLFIDVAISTYNEQAGTNYTQSDFNQNTKEALSKYRQEQAEYQLAAKRLTDGLLVSEFGLHNVDQIMASKNPISFNAVFVDENRKPILLGDQTFYVIDVNLNAAFSCDANHPVSIDKSSKTLFVALSNKGDLYVGDNYQSYNSNLVAGKTNTIQLVNKSAALTSADAFNDFIQEIR